LVDRSYTPRSDVRPSLLQCEQSGYALYFNEGFGFPDLDERDKATIEQDVRRSFTRFPGHSSILRRLYQTLTIQSESNWKKGSSELCDLYCACTRDFITCKYIHHSSQLIQGLHDIAEIILLVTDENEGLCCKLLHRLSLLNFRGMIFEFCSNTAKIFSSLHSNLLSPHWISSLLFCNG